MYFSFLCKDNFKRIMLDTRSKLDERDEDQIEKYHTEEELIRKYGIPRDEVTVKEHISRAIKRNLWCSGA